jgi:hypothetical protein
MKSVYCAVQTGSLNNAVCASTLKLNGSKSLLLLSYLIFRSSVVLISIKLAVFCKRNLIADHGTATCSWQDEIIAQAKHELKISLNNGKTVWNDNMSESNGPNHMPCTQLH